MKKLLLMTMLMVGGLYTAQAQYENTTIKIGMKAPELAFEDVNGKEIKLSEVNKNRYVLIDFWASWCGPCRRANPALVKLYDQYHNQKNKEAKKGFTIYSVSLDRGKPEWLAAIAKDNLKWTNHVSDLGYWNSTAAKIYGVQFIPQAFLLDPKGNIIGKYMLAEEVAPDLERIFGKK